MKFNNRLLLPVLVVAASMCGAGLDVVGNVEVTCRDCAFIDNSVGGHGGGVSFDFQNESDRRFRLMSPGDPGCLVESGAAWTKGERRNAKGVRIRESTQIVKLPSATGGVFRVSFRYRSRHFDDEKSFLLIYFKKRTPDGRQWEGVKGLADNGGSHYGCPLAEGAASWAVFSKTYGVRPGCEALECILRVDGDGELDVRDFALSVDDGGVDEEPLTLSPHGMLDNRFEVSEGQCGAIGFHWNQDSVRGRNFLRGEFRFAMPPGFDFLGTSFGDAASVRRTRRTDGSAEVAFRTGAGFSPRWANFNRMTVLVKSTGRAGDGGRARLEARDSDGRLVATAEFDLATVSPIAAVPPRRFMCGVFPSGSSVFFNDSAADREFARFMGECGVRWLVSDKCFEALVDMWHESGIRFVTPELQVANGYFMGGDDAMRPAADRFRFSPTTEDWRMGHDAYLARGTCPLAVVEERPFFLTNSVEKSIRRRMFNADGGWANWEPYLFATRGCDCDRCKAAFAKWHGETGGSLADFRSLMHGKVVKTIARHVARFGNGAAVGFVPGVSWHDLSSNWKGAELTREAMAKDYAGALKWINSWGPYRGWDSKTPYSYAENATLAHFVATKDVRERVDRDFPPASRPKLLGFTHGLQDREWVTQPEHLSMAFDSYFFNRWEACVAYFFPQGYDARYWRAFAAAATRAAKFEDFVFDGRRVDGKVALKPSAEFPKPCDRVLPQLPQCRNISLLQFAAYELGGETIVAAFNFWDKGEARFLMRVSGLEGYFSVVDEDGKRHAPSPERAFWRGNELGRGVPLALGAARTKVFRIAPVGTGVLKGLVQ